MLEACVRRHLLPKNPPSLSMTSGINGTFCCRAKGSFPGPPKPSGLHGHLWEAVCMDHRLHPLKCMFMLFHLLGVILSPLEGGHTCTDNSQSSSHISFYRRLPCLPKLSSPLPNLTGPSPYSSLTLILTRYPSLTLNLT